ncbi:MAG TPA: hypothetical protein VL173_14600 [Vicinamibacterales bacterium]|jgi:hypothetical protein|nr:hypothetical protein [Vicinamibacterales bacterium]
MAEIGLQNGWRTVQRRRWIAIAVAVVVVVGGVFTWVEFFRRVPPPAMASDEENFEYGSLGNERADGIPYWLWLVLPRVFPEHLPAPGGYAAIGFLSQPGRELPIGFSKATIGYERVALNCAGCHMASARLQPDTPLLITPSRQPQTHASEAYLRFLIACASDPRFTAQTLMAEIAKNYHLSASERLAYRLAIIPATRRAILRLTDRPVLIDHDTMKQHADASKVTRVDTYLHSLH